MTTELIILLWNSEA